MGWRGWTDNQKRKVRELLTEFNGSDEVCAETGRKPEDLDRLCKNAFGLDFAAAQAHFAAKGRVKIRRALMQKAADGDMKALDMLAREQLGMGAVEQRRRNLQDRTEVVEADDQDEIALIIARRAPDRMPDPD